MITLYFLRHGAVENPENIFYGRLPRYHLSATGRQQVLQAAAFLRDKRISEIYSSPLLRARQSAQLLKDVLHIARIHTTKNLLEIHTPMQGKSFSRIRAINYDVFAHGESIAAIAERMHQFVEQMEKKYPGQHICAVSHGDPIMILKLYLLGLPLTNEFLRKQTGTWGEAGYIQPGALYQFRYHRGKVETLTPVFAPTLQ